MGSEVALRVAETLDSMGYVKECERWLKEEELGRGKELRRRDVIIRIT